MMSMHMILVDVPPDACQGRRRGRIPYVGRATRVGVSEWLVMYLDSS